MSTPLLRGFPPVVDDCARTLILGSFPSAQSLAAGQYYANPRNAFWSITGELLGFDGPGPTTAGCWHCNPAVVALWDVLHACRRAGSSDSAIEPKSLAVNDFDELFARYPTITAVYFNGAKAADLFHRLVRAPDRIQYRRLPSTSPAHAVGRDVKLAAWRVTASAAQPGEAGHRP